MVGFLKKGMLSLAPMSAFTDSAFRVICRKCGADVCISEFVHCRAVLSGAKKILCKLEFEQEERPYGVQLFGSDAFEMADAACLIEENFAPDFIDINYGCPAPNAVDAGAGAFLLKDPQKMAQIAERVARSIKIPTTAKMRIGWDAQHIVALDAAKMLQDSGIKAIALHGRTKTQGYSGSADWNIIESVANALEIAVIGNGSVEKLSAVELRNSACFGFMVGRAALGNPWIFAEVKAKMSGEIFEAADVKTKVETVRFYLEKILKNQDKYDLVNVRNSIMAFMKNFVGSKELRIKISKMKNLVEIRKILSEFLEQ